MIPPVSPGDVLGDKYRVERVLGAGGMGVVVEATHLGLDQRIAIKFLREESSRIPSVVERFSREARAMIRIKSEHVARVFDVGQTAAGAPYMVMEYLEGRDLSAWLEELGTVAVTDAIDVVLQACEAIAEAHALGIIHRDLKPANLFLTARADGTPCVKVLDFGISKIAPTGSGAQAMSLTHTAVPLGSPLYMAPEQIASARDVDERADIWSLGAMLYELITGHVPFDADHFAHLQYKILHEKPIPLRERDPDLPAGLDDAVMKCLLKNPDERHRNIAELGRALAPFGGPHAATSATRIAAVMSRAVNAASPPSTVPGSWMGFRPTEPMPAEVRASVEEQSAGTTPLRAGKSPTPRHLPPTAAPPHADRSRTVSAFGATGRPMTRSRWLLLAAAPALVAAAAIAWVALRSTPAPLTSPVELASGAPPASTPWVAAVEPPPAPPGTPGSATVLVADETAPSASSAALAPPGKAPDPRRTIPPSQTHGAGDADLFNTRK